MKGFRDLSVFSVLLLLIVSLCSCANDNNQSNEAEQQSPQANKAIVCNNLLMGGYVVGAWHKPEEFTYLLQEGTEYELFQLTADNEYIGTGKGSAPYQGNSANKPWLVNIKTKDVLAVTSGRGIFTRKTNRNADYDIDSFDMVMDQLDYPEIAPKITECVSADIDGDGKDERLAVLTDGGELPATGVSPDANYCVVALQYQEKNDWISVPIIYSIYPPIKSNIDKPYMDTQWMFGIVALADFDGDGRLEIVLREQNSSGYGYVILTTADDFAPTKVLENGIFD